MVCQSAPYCPGLGVTFHSAHHLLFQRRLFLMWRDCPKRALYGISLVFNFGIPNPANLPFLACLSHCLRWMEVGGSSYSALPHLIYSVRCWLEIQLDQPKGWGMVRLLELPHSLFHSRTSWRDFQDYSTCICEVGSLKRSCTIWGYCKAPHINSCPQTTTFFFIFFFFITVPETEKSYLL